MKFEHGFVVTYQCTEREEGFATESQRTQRSEGRKERKRKRKRKREKERAGRRKERKKERRRRKEEAGKREQEEGAGRGGSVRASSEDETLDALVEEASVEVDQEAGFEAAEAKVGQELRFEDRIHPFYVFQFEYDRLFHDDVHAQIADGDIAIGQRERGLARSNFNPQ
ncbi:MAG TPA: hypothetical protein VKT53_01290 [Candidatus Acidoferrum sp.]|nr:hypothetical protein [Candidatus Acidoferrum sp.]